MSESTPLPVAPRPAPKRRLPPWLKRPAPVAEALLQTRRLIDGLALNTVCVEARCPNLTECWSRRTATFMILGDKCTRRCRFCAVRTARPDPPDEGEPQRLAEAAERLGLRHVVITSVARDDLKDEGAGHFAQCVRTVRQRLPHATIEVLVPDFHARRECIEVVLAAAPEVFNHNVEVVRSRQKRVRPQARYQCSLETLRLAKELSPSAGTEVGRYRPKVMTKSGIMVGLGETREELLETFGDLRAVGCDLLTIGQYLQPSADGRTTRRPAAAGDGHGHLPVERYYRPEEFEELADLARSMGFAGVASGPFVRSSYFAETLCLGAAPDRCP